MISESRYWKVPLLRAATWLEHVRLEESNSERLLVRVERELFIGFYAIRKLLETFKLSPCTKSMSFSLAWSPCVRMVDYFNAHRIDELFDLSTVQHEEHNLEFLCNQFIHSYVFSPVQEHDGSLAGALVCSDRLRQDKIYFVAITQISQAFRTVGKDYPVSQHLQRNRKTNQWEEITP